MPQDARFELPLVLAPPPPPPLPGATPEQIAEVCAESEVRAWTSEAFLRVFQQEPSDAEWVITIQGLPAFGGEFQLAVAARAQRSWRLDAWFLQESGTIAQCLADLKLHKPSLSMDEAIAALQVRKISLDIDPDSAEWSWIRGLSRVSTPLVRQPDTSLDGISYRIKVDGPGLGPRTLLSLRNDELPELTTLINRLETTLRQKAGKGPIPAPKAP